MNILNNSELNKLYKVEDTLEKTIINIIKRFQNSEQYFTGGIIDIFEETSRTRSKELEHIKTQARKIVHSLRSKTDLLNNKNLQEITDFDKFKQEMIEIQENIMNLKKYSKEELQNFKKISDDLNDELSMYYNEKVTDWEENCSINANYDVPSKIKIKSTEECKEVKSFLDFVYQSGGHENGWSKEDHVLFLKYKARYKNIDDVAFHLHETLPDISIEQVKTHFEWHVKYLNLKSRKKKAIITWKQSKNVSNARNSGNNSSGYGKQMKRDNNDNEKLREKLQQWKAEKEQKLVLEKHLNYEKLMEKIEKERLERQKQLEVRKLVEEWKESKIVYEEYRVEMNKMQEEKEKKRKASLANKLIKRFQSLDELHIVKMRQIHQKMKGYPVQRAQSGPSVLRNPTRLLQPTIQWAHKVKSVKEPAIGIVPMFSSSKLAIPDWRKNLT